MAEELLIPENAKLFASWLGAFLSRHGITTSWTSEQKAALWPQIEAKAKEFGINDLKPDGSFSVV